MKIFISSAIILFISAGLFAYQARAEILATRGDLKVVLNYTFEQDSAKITMPRRARIVSVNSPGKNTVNYFNNGNALIIANMQIQYAGKITLTYIIPVPEGEFYLDNWLAESEESGTILASINLPQGYRGLFFPYDIKTQDGYYLDQAESPVLIAGKYQYLDDSYSGTHYELYYQNRLQTSMTNIDSLVRSFEGILTPVGKKNILLFTLPALQNSVKFTKDSVFISLNGTSMEEIKKGLAALWFKGILTMNNNSISAFTDLFRRLITDSGSIQTDDGMIVPMPNDDYYKKVIEKGFPSKDEVNCDINGMMKNFALLDLAYDIVGIQPFLNGVGNLAAPKNSSNLTLSFQLAPEKTPAANYVLQKLFPIAPYSPSLSLRGTTAFKNNDSIPDTTMRIGSETRPVLWSGKRGIDTGSYTGIAVLDPDHLIPMQSRFSAMSVSSPSDLAEWNLVIQVISGHKKYSEESFREIIDLRKFQAPAANAFSINQGMPVYIGITKFFAPINGKLVTGLKELVVTVTNSKATIMGIRVRY